MSVRIQGKKFVYALLVISVTAIVACSRHCRNQPPWVWTNRMRVWATLSLWCVWSSAKARSGLRLVLCGPRKIFFDGKLLDGLRRLADGITFECLAKFLSRDELKPHVALKYSGVFLYCPTSNVALCHSQRSYILVLSESVVSFYQRLLN